MTYVCVALKYGGCSAHAQHYFSKAVAMWLKVVDGRRAPPSSSHGIHGVPVFGGVTDLDGVPVLAGVPGSVAFLHGS